MRVGTKKSKHQPENPVKRQDSDSGKGYPVAGKINSGTVMLDLLTVDYKTEHWKLIDFISKANNLELMRNIVPVKGKGYVKVYIKKTGTSFELYGLKFEPYHIISKYWGLRVPDADPGDFIFFECLYEDDFTRFRGCFKI